MVGGVRCVERSEVSGKSGGVREKWSVVGGVEECGGRGRGVWWEGCGRGRGVWREEWCMGGADVIKMQLSCMSSAKVIGARASIIAGADCRIGTIYTLWI